MNTVSADIQVQGVRGAQRLQAVSADIETEAAGEDVECKTVSGDISVKGEGKPGLLTITTVSGDAQVHNVAGEVFGNTVSGNFNFSLGDTSRSKLSSTSGDVTLKGKLLETRGSMSRASAATCGSTSWESRTPNSTSRASMARSATASARSRPGRTNTRRVANCGSARAQGSARVRIKTLNGDISFCNK